MPVFAPPPPNNRASFGSPVVAPLSYDVGVVGNDAGLCATDLWTGLPWSRYVVLQLQGVRCGLPGGLPEVRINLGLEPGYLIQKLARRSSIPPDHGSGGPTPARSWPARPTPKWQVCPRPLLRPATPLPPPRPPAAMPPELWDHIADFAAAPALSRVCRATWARLQGRHLRLRVTPQTLRPALRYCAEVRAALRALSVEARGLEGPELRAAEAEWGGLRAPHLHTLSLGLHGAALHEGGMAVLGRVLAMNAAPLRCLRLSLFRCQLKVRGGGALWGGVGDAVAAATIQGLAGSLALTLCCRVCHPVPPAAGEGGAAVMY